MKMMMKNAEPTSALNLKETLARTEAMAGPQKTLPASTDVLIVGGGPAGLTAAHLLAAYGVSCVLIERNQSTSQQPKAVSVDDEYLRLLTNLGIGDKVRQDASAPFGIHFISSRDEPLVTVNAFHTPNGFGNRVAISQPLFEKTLLDVLLRGNNTVCFGAEMVSIRQAGTSAEVQIRNPQGQVQVMAARYVLACDGAKSPVRTQLGIGFPGKRIDEPHLVIDLADFPDQTPASRFHCNPARPFNSIPGPFGGRRLEFMLQPGDNEKWLLSDAGIRWMVDSFSPYKGMELHIIRRAIYGFSERIADQLQQGCIFLLGDAAHVMPPFGGQGLNTGARDAANIAWKLAAVIRHSANPNILNSYDTERRDQIAKVVRYSVRIGKLTNIRSKRLARLRDRLVQLVNLYPPARTYLAQMRYLPRPRIQKGLVFRDAQADGERIGTVFPRIQLRTADGQTLAIDQYVGFRHALVLLGCSERQYLDAVQAVRQAMAHVVVVHIQAPGAASARDDAVWPCDALGEQMFSAPFPQAILIRPDRYIAAAGPANQCGSMLNGYFSTWTRPASRSVSPSHPLQF